MKQLILIISSILLIVPVWGCSNQGDSGEFPVILKCDGLAEIGKSAPNFTWVDNNNIEHSLADFKGKSIVIVTWDIGCKICVEKILPYINSNYDQYSKQGVVILSINNGDRVEALKEHVIKYKYVFPVLIDKLPYTFRSYYQLKPGNPYIILINKTGTLIKNESPGDAETANKLIKSLMDSN